MFIMNRTDRYRLEALMELATIYPEARSSSELAARRGIPAAYLPNCGRGMDISTLSPCMTSRSRTTSL